MYDTVFQDRILEYSPTSSTDAAPIIGNGNLFIHMDAGPTSLSRAIRTRIGTSDTIGFTEVTRDNVSLPPVKSKALYLSNGTFRASNGVAEDELVSSVLAVRQSPSSVVQTVTVRDEGTLIHTLRPPRDLTITRADLVIKNAGGFPLPHLAVEGKIGTESVAYCCVYCGTGLGETVFLDGVRDPDPGTTSVRSVLRTTSRNETVSMLHTVLHGDGVTAAHAFRKSLLHFRTDMDPAQSLANVKKLHSQRWASLWKGNVSVDAKASATTEERESMRIFNIHLQTSLYRLLADLPDPSAISFIREGEIPARPYTFMDGLAMAPLLPWLHFSQPIPPPEMWTPMYEVAGRILDAWDGYRVTLDRSLLDDHFRTLKYCANELTVRIENAAPSSTTGAKATVGMVKTRSGAYVSDDPYTTGTARRALESMEQVCNVLRVPPQSIWEKLKDSLVVPRSSAFTTEIANTRPPSDTQDGLVLLHPGMLRHYGSWTDVGPFTQLLDGNAQALEAASQGPACPAAFSAIGTLASDTSRLASVADIASRIDACFDRLMAQCASTMDARWGAASHMETSTASDILACVMFGFLRMRVRGYVTRDGVHSTPAQLVPGPATLILPRAWRVARRRVSRTVGQQSESLTQNSR